MRLPLPLQRPAFFFVRAVLGTICTICEAKLYDTVRLKVNNRVARYMLFMLVASAGMWNASTGESLPYAACFDLTHLPILENPTCSALLPSTFAMYTTMLALSHAFIPPSNQDSRRTLAAVLYFTLGAAVGWPFALAVAIPFVFEELFVFGADKVPANEKSEWQLNRGKQLIVCGAVAALITVSTPSFPYVVLAERWADTYDSDRFILLREILRRVLEHSKV
jgi:alpha-1,2-mannosyltransferase